MKGEERKYLGKYPLQSQHTKIKYLVVDEAKTKDCLISLENVGYTIIEIMLLAAKETTVAS